MVEEKDQELEITKDRSRHDTLGAVIWALILIWAGIVFLVGNTGYLDNLLLGASRITGLQSLDRVLTAWPLVLLGAGVLLLTEVILRVLMPAFRRPIFGTLILAVVFIGVALGDLINWNLIWPSILIVLGLSVMLRGFTRHR